MDIASGSKVYSEAEKLILVRMRGSSVLPQETGTVQATMQSDDTLMLKMQYLSCTKMVWLELSFISELV